MRFVQLIGYLAGFLTVVSYLPQAVRAWRTRQTKDLSFGTFALLVTAGACWIAYGILGTDWPVIATNVGTTSLNIALVVAKLRFK